MRMHTRTWSLCTGMALVAASLTVTSMTPSLAAPATDRSVITGSAASTADDTAPRRAAKPRKPTPVKPPKGTGGKGKGKPTYPPFVPPTSFEYVRSDCRREDEGSFRVVHHWLVSGGVYRYSRGGAGKPVNVYHGEPQTISRKVTVAEPGWAPEDGPLPAPTEGVAQGSMIVSPIGKPSTWQQIALPEQAVTLDCAE